MRSAMVLIASLLLASTASLPALAQETSCPGNDWFCSRNEDAPAEPKVVQEGAPQKEDTRAPTVVVIVRPETPTAAPSTSQPTSTGSLHQAAAGPTKPHALSTSMPRVGFELRAHRLDLPPSSDDIGAFRGGAMYGGGGGLRMLFTPRIELDALFDVFYGTDHKGFDRVEFGTSVDLLAHLTPHSALRIYPLLGIFIGFGNVASDKQTRFTPTIDEEGNYFAAYGIASLNMGMGVEVPLTPSISFRTDAIFAMRWRFAAAQDSPEYWNEQTGRGENSYMSLLLRTGVTIW